MPRSRHRASAKGLKVLLIDDNPDDRILVTRELKNTFSSLDVIQVFDPSGLGLALENGDIDLVITDYHLQWTDGLKIFQKIKDLHPDTPVIMFTGTGNEEIAVEAMKSGLDDYIIKSPKHFSRLRAAAKQVMERALDKRAHHEVDNRYRMFIENFRGILYQGKMDFTPIFFHGDVQKITGYSEEEFRAGDPRWDQIIHEEDLETLKDSIKRVGGEPGYHTIRQYRIRHRNGNLRLIEESIQNVCDEEGRPEYVQGVIYDITYKAAMEETLNRTRQLATLGQLASGMAHELNNPLATILACSDFMLALFDDPGPFDGDRLELFQENLPIIKKEAERSGRIISDLLDFAPGRSFDIVSLDLKELILTTIRMFSISNRHQKYIFDVKLDEDVPDVAGDRDKIHQVLVSLLNNAMDAMPDGGSISIACRDETDKKMVAVDIEDKGRGIPSDQLGHIFDPFFTTKPYSKGTGLGLTIVDSIVSYHNGRVEVHSQEGKGATFRVLLPYAENS